jgi:hypothetical protein
MVVRQNQPVFADDEACARRYRGLFPAPWIPALSLTLIVLIVAVTIARLVEKSTEEVFGAATAAAEEVREVLPPLLRLGPDVDHHRLLRFRDVAERLRVNRSGDRRAVLRREREGRLRRRGGRQIRDAITMPTTSDDTAIRTP